MKIYTKTGDKGETSLLSGNRVPKYHLRIETYGTVDELNANIGMLRSQEIDNELINLLIEVQTKLFNIGSTLALDENKNNLVIPKISESDILLLESEMDKIEKQLPPLRNFVLPGGHQTVAICHLCRTVCRRAERLCVHLATEVEVDTLIIKYLNRLSDYFFMLSRKLANDLNLEQITWNQKK